MVVGGDENTLDIIFLIGFAPRPREHFFYLQQRRVLMKIIGYSAPTQRPAWMMLADDDCQKQI